MRSIFRVRPAREISIVLPISRAFDNDEQSAIAPSLPREGRRRFVGCENTRSTRNASRTCYVMLILRPNLRRISLERGRAHSALKWADSVEGPLSSEGRLASRCTPKVSSSAFRSFHTAASLSLSPAVSSSLFLSLLLSLSISHPSIPCSSRHTRRPLRANMHAVIFAGQRPVSETVSPSLG